ncbi:MAG TPA: tetratricopeptide repeat protein, partial [Pyrinomonadaceae bacterium]|nr:tetratricopeptide repeat protein [Pyrinomonadaceae bacterium]
MIKTLIKRAWGRGFMRGGLFSLLRLLAVLPVSLLLHTDARGVHTFESSGTHLESVAAAPCDAAQVLAPGEMVKRYMKAGETHAFQLSLAAQQYAQVVVAQRGVDVAVRVCAPDGAVLVEMDSPNGLYGLETVSVIAPIAGSYRVEVVSSKTMPSGDYELTVEGPRASSQADERRVAAERLFLEAQTLRLGAGRSASRVEAAEKYDLAIRKYKEARDIWRALGERRGEGYSLASIGRAHKAQGQRAEAFDYLGQALSCLREAQDISGQAFVLNETGAAHRDLGDPLVALDSYSLALELRRSVKDVWGQAQLYNNVGHLYSNIGQQYQAIENFNKALPLWRTSGDRPMEMNTLNNIAKSYSDIGDMSLAFEKYQEVLNFIRETDNHVLEPSVLNSIGRIYDTWGESDEALSHYEAALKLFRESKNVEGEAIVLDNIGMMYAGLGDAQRALGFFEDALKLRRILKMPRGEAVTQSNLGYAQTLLGNHLEALKYLELALTLSRASSNKIFEAYTLIHTGLAYVALGEPRRALEKYEAALAIQTELSDRRGQAMTLDRMGQAHALLGESAKALGRYGQALERWAAVGDKQGQALSLYGVAQVERDRGQLPVARDKIEEAINLVESLRYKMTGNQLRMTYFAGKQDFYALAIDVRMRLYDSTRAAADLEAALSASERARARNLLDLLSEARADLHKGMSPQDAEKSRRLEKEISALAQTHLQLRNSKRMEDAANVERRLAALLNELEALQARSGASGASPVAARQARTLRPREIQELLDTDTLILEYALGEKRSHLWAVTRNGITAHALAGRAEIEQASERLRKALTIYEPRKPGESAMDYLTLQRQAPALYRQAALELGRLVLAPVSSQLGHKRLIVVADGALQYIPFEVLLLPGAPASVQTSTDRATHAALLSQNEVSYLPSASTLALLRGAPRRSGAKTVAVLADPVFDEKDRRVRSSVNGQDAAGEASSPVSSGALSRALRDLGDVAGEDLKLERLVYTADEANAITGLAPAGSSLKAMGFKANRATATSGVLRDFNIVHFATHSILNDKHPELSGIVLSMVDEQGRPADGYLSLRDIYNLDLPVNLVVLSACRTGVDIGQRSVAEIQALDIPETLKEKLIPYAGL